MADDEGFICALCGRRRYIRAGSNVSAYCRECWAGYGRFKYHMKREGKLDTIRQYRQYRKQHGLPTPELEPSRGRKPKHSTVWICPTCRDGGHERTSLGFCTQCRKNWLAWVIVDPRITPEVFWVVQKSTLNTQYPNGMFAVPLFGLQRVLPPEIKGMLNNTPEETLAHLKKNYQEETGGE